MANAEKGRFGKAGKVVNAVRKLDIVAMGATAVVVPLQKYHRASVEGFVMGELIWQGLLKPSIEFGRDLGRQFKIVKSTPRGTSSREASSLPVAA